MGHLYVNSVSLAFLAAIVWSCAGAPIMPGLVREGNPECSYNDCNGTWVPEIQKCCYSPDSDGSCPRVDMKKLSDRDLCCFSCAGYGPREERKTFDGKDYWCSVPPSNLQCSKLDTPTM